MVLTRSRLFRYRTEVQKIHSVSLKHGFSEIDTTNEMGITLVVPIAYKKIRSRNYFLLKKTTQAVPNSTKAISELLE